jgi:hypothetical protein
MVSEGGRIMRIRSLVTVGMLMCAPSGFAKPIEIQSFEESYAELKSASVVIFDIDNTILRPIQTLGSDQWYGYRVQTHLDAGLELNQAISKAVREWTSVQMKTQVQLTESNIPEIFAWLRQLGVPVLGLTARPLELIEKSIQQLASVQVRFDNNAIRGGTINVRAPDPARFDRGILFVGPKNNKGSVLRDFLSQIAFSPRKIAFLDDKEKHIVNVEKALEGSGIEYSGFRYGRMDAWVKSFDAALAEKQWDHFTRTGELLSDEVCSETSPFDRFLCESFLEKSIRF